MDGSGSSRYVAECFWPGVTASDVVGAADRIARWIEVREGEASDGERRLACEGWILMPADEVVFLVFRAISADLVWSACTGADVDVERVVEALTATPPC